VLTIQNAMQQGSARKRDVDCMYCVYTLLKQRA